MHSKPLFVHTITPLHAGTGQGVGVIDLPIAREIATGIPYLPGSSLKGVLRDHAKTSLPQYTKLFGPETKNAADHASAAQFTDQRLLLLPVRSFKGTFAWVTSPLVLHRFKRELALCGQDDLPAVPLLDEVDLAITTKAANIKVGNRVILEDIDLDPQINEDGTAADCDAWATWLGDHVFPADESWQQLLGQKLCIVHDDAFGYLLQTATEIVARNVLDEQTKTSLNLWYEEMLPAESILYGLVVAQQVKVSGLTPDEVLVQVATFDNKIIQLGGHASIGRGLCRLQFNKEVSDA